MQPRASPRRRLTTRSRDHRKRRDRVASRSRPHRRKRCFVPLRGLTTPFWQSIAGRQGVATTWMTVDCKSPKTQKISKYATPRRRRNIATPGTAQHQGGTPRRPSTVATTGRRSTSVSTPPRPHNFPECRRTAAASTGPRRPTHAHPDDRRPTTHYYLEGRRTAAASTGPRRPVVTKKPAPGENPEPVMRRGVRGCSPVSRTDRTGSRRRT
jgi:hypothetical protein